MHDLVGVLTPWDHGHLHREAQESRRPKESGAPACLCLPRFKKLFSLQPLIPLRTLLLSAQSLQDTRAL